MSEKFVESWTKQPFLSDIFIYCLNQWLEILIESLLFAKERDSAVFPDVGQSRFYIMF